MNLPQDFKLRMQEMLGEEYDAFAASYDRAPFAALRVNTLKIKKENFKELMPFTLKEVPWCETGFFYGESAKRKDEGERMPETESACASEACEDEAKERPGKHVFHEMGLYYMQEPSAMAVAELADVTPGERVLDLCAAPGGKSTQLAAKLQGRGLLISNEIHPARCKILSQNIERMGITNAVVTNETPQGLSPHFMNFFDCIVVDAPCSGEGMFRKEEEAVHQWSLDNVKMCADRQDEILEEAVKMLRSGGRIVYSTCTFAPAEDEACVARFLNRYPDFEVEKNEAYPFFASGNPAWAGGDERVKGTYRLWPHRIPGEGHFVAVLRHKGKKVTDGGINQDGAFGYKTGSSDAKKKKAKSPLDKEKQALYEEFIKDCLKEDIGGEKVLFGDALYAMPCELNIKGLKVLRPGLHIGTFEKKRFEPSHSLALALSSGDVTKTLHLSAESGLPAKYIRGESLPAEGEKGWTLVCVEGYSAGWGKVSNGVLKNHYPKGLRK